MLFIRAYRRFELSSQDSTSWPSASPKSCPSAHLTLRADQPSTSSNGLVLHNLYVAVLGPLLEPYLPYILQILNPSETPALPLQAEDRF